MNDKVKKVKPATDPRAVKLAEIMRENARQTTGAWKAMRECFVDGEGFVTVEEFAKIAEQAKAIAKAGGFLSEASCGVYFSYFKRALAGIQSIPETQHEFNKLVKDGKIPKLSTRGRTAGSGEGEEGEGSKVLADTMAKACEVLECEPADVAILAKDGHEFAAIITLCRAAMKRGVTEKQIRGAIVGLGAKDAETEETGEPEARQAEAKAA